MLTSRSPATSKHAGVLSAAEFTARVRRALAVTAPALAITERQGLRFDIQSAGAAPWTEDLTRAYDVYSGEPSLLDDLIRLRVASVLDMATIAAAAPATDLLLPVLRRRDEVAGSDALHGVYSDCIAITWTVDRLGLPTTLTEAAAEQLGLSAAEISCSAIEHLDRRRDEVSIETTDHGVVVIASATLPASSLVLAPSFWSADIFQGFAALAAIAPARHILARVRWRRSQGAFRRAQPRSGDFRYVRVAFEH